MYIVREIFKDKKIIKKNKIRLNIDFDFPNWLENHHLPFNKFKNESKYELNFDQKRVNYLKSQMFEQWPILRSKSGGDKERAFNKYIMQNMQSIDVHMLEKRFEKVS